MKVWKSALYGGVRFKLMLAPDCSRDEVGGGQNCSALCIPRISRHIGRHAGQTWKTLKCTTMAWEGQVYEERVCQLGQLSQLSQLGQLGQLGERRGDSLAHNCMMSCGMLLACFLPAISQTGTNESSSWSTTIPTPRSHDRTVPERIAPIPGRLAQGCELTLQSTAVPPLSSGSLEARMPAEDRRDALTGCCTSWTPGILESLAGLSSHRPTAILVLARAIGCSEAQAETHSLRWRVVAGRPYAAVLLAMH
jgi:hypothetical protein